MEILALILSISGATVFGIMLITATMDRYDITFVAAIVGTLLWAALVVVCAVLGSYVVLLIALLNVSLGVLNAATANELR